MYLPDIFRTSTFRLAAMFAVSFSLATLILFSFIYWQTAVFETGRIDAFIEKNAAQVATEPREAREQAVASRILGDLHRISFAAIFDANGNRVVGNLERMPADLPRDGRAHEARGLRTAEGSASELIRAVALGLPDGSVVVIGRDVEELQKLRELVVRALGLGVLPAFVLALLTGAFVSRRAQDRVKAVHRAAERILRGDLRERLPTVGSADDFDRLASSVNHMLDEISRLLENVKAAGDDIAHDLRTPLARLRTRLERARNSSASQGDLERTIDSAIGDLDQTMGIVTTLLRIGEIDSGRQRAAFTHVDLSDLITEIDESYTPVAEERGVKLRTIAESGLVIWADPGLMLEAVANLVHNAIKYSPVGAAVLVEAVASPRGPIFRVTDDGPGVPPAERERIFDRFYRIDKSRSVEGSGLGLSLVASIVKLHGFKVSVGGDEAGAVFEILCRIDGGGSAG